ncbi:mitochondrial translation release factor in rescue-like [Mercenaria mercenaria]|uniref:mitochondrial translation release factor in rescue-like n=1 Tax=Mercenaria mercenaria TaxID=6596 RepID=UPI00234EB82A|nr:mitochondrial translation release factor in rescue-like [Mercenaria mercenaria]
MSVWKTLGASLHSSRTGLKLTSPQLQASVLLRPVSKKTYAWPELKEDDIEEEFIRGSGPGGQAVAKTSNCVQLKHIPTGIVVKSHETRAQSENRKIARQKLVYQLDILYNKDNSFDAISKREAAQQKKSRENKAKKRQELKKEFKAREGLD